MVCVTDDDDTILGYTIKSTTTLHEHMPVLNAVAKEALYRMLHGVVRTCTMIAMYLRIFTRRDFMLSTTVLVS